LCSKPHQQPGIANRFGGAETGEIGGLLHGLEGFLRFLAGGENGPLQGEGAGVFRIGCNGVIDEFRAGIKLAAAQLDERGGQQDGRLVGRIRLGEAFLALGHGLGRERGLGEQQQGFAMGRGALQHFQQRLAAVADEAKFNMACARPTPISSSLGSFSLPLTTCGGVEHRALAQQNQAEALERLGITGLRGEHVFELDLGRRIVGLREMLLAAVSLRAALASPCCIRTGE